jgi:hypothetical protein
MPNSRPPHRKKHFTIEQANQMLPLVRAIVGDIRDLASDLQVRRERMQHARPKGKGSLGSLYDEEARQSERDLGRDAAKLEEYVDELRKLGVELKGWDGLVDFPSMMDGREIYLCWKLGESEVAHWHELNAGFSGRQKLYANAATCDGDTAEASES